jgi:hypothetical protein
MASPLKTQQTISLPRGGGAIKGIGETFQPNLFSGTGNFSVPIFTSPGRNGFGPQLTLQYSTGNGNGPFGLGWQLSIPRITRKTEKGLPTYTDDDIFVLSGTEDLVPFLGEVANEPNRWTPVGLAYDDYMISFYRPRTEGQFARIERWENQEGDVHWRAITKENVTSIYGHTAKARLVDPRYPEHVFEWLLEETFDAKGNHIAYEYVQEDAALELRGIHEHNRSYTQAYIRRILYGNTPDGLEPNRKAGPIRTATDHANPLQTRERHYVFEVLFDYGDIPSSVDIPGDFPVHAEGNIPVDWPVREDPFSTFRAGFEIRTLRRCQRVLMLHHFTEGELAGAPLVKATQFGYTINPDTQLSFLASVTIGGFRKDPDDPQRYIQRDMPPVSFNYSAFEPHKQRYQSVTSQGGDLPPQRLNAPGFTLLDVFGNGLPDILQTSEAGFFHWENLGQGRISRRHLQPGYQPAVSIAQNNVSFGDMGGDGLADLVVDAPPMSGFYESTAAGGWRAFRRFETTPDFELADPNTRLVDLTGDGLSDVLVARDEHFLWYRCRGEAGYEQPRRVPRTHDLDVFPDVYFADPAGRVRLADMSGDGLNDIVLVHDGRLDYWPNLGYGRFGSRITMANAPRIGYGFDPRRLFLVDLDGTGCADMVYVESGEVRFWFNQSGNAWSVQQSIRGTPPVADLTAVQFSDFYGTGTATLVWSYDYGEQPGGNYKILDFCGGRKPNLLIEMDNNMGATTRAQYASSTRFYLQDKAEGRPWVTSLPFPVQVLEKTEVIDHISKTKLTTTYRYHHGYYDGREREFRGFGRVDQFDTEFFQDFVGSSLHGPEAVFDNNEKGFYVPPVETRTWFHSGVYFDPDRFIDHRELTQQFRGEYYQDDSDAFSLEEHFFEQADGSQGLGETPHEAFRTLRGAVLRTEVFGRDGSETSDHPYAVTENRYTVKALQPKNGNNHSVYLTLPKEGVSYHYERNPTDPRVSHNITLGFDDFGNVTDNVAIAYPRRIVPDGLPEQGETKIVYTRTDFINEYSPPTVTAPAFYYAGVPCQTRTYEVTGITWQFGQRHLGAQMFADILDRSMDVDTRSFMPYEWRRGETDSGVLRRIIEWTRSYFRTDADPAQIDPIGSLEHRLPLGRIESLGLPYEGYQAAFTRSLVQQIYGERITGIDLPGEGGYHPHPNYATAEGGGAMQAYWWIPSGRQGFDPEKFFGADRTQDPFGNVSSSDADAYALLLESARDSLPAPQTNVISARNDYRVLQPFEVTEPNGNRSQVAFDALGLVVGTAVMGEDAQGNAVGDSLVGFAADLSDELRDHHIDDPLNLDSASDTDGHHILQGASSRLVYDLNRFFETGQPNVVYTLARETHVSDQRGVPAKVQHSFTYSDGFGRESQTKIQAEPDPADQTRPRWAGTGTTVYNNKGKPVQQFEPFFSDDHRYGIERHGVSPTMFFDPLERVVCTVLPDHTYGKVVFNPWQQTTWDGNDTLLLDPRTDSDVVEYARDYFQRYDRDYADEHGEPPTTWYQESLSSTDTARQQAARKTEPHANTPAVVHLDTLGRAFLTIADNGVDDDGKEQKYATRVLLDIEGNQLEVIDAEGRIVMRYDYDMLSVRLHQTSMEAGERWMLNDAAGQPLYGWDSRDHQFRTVYDPLRRPTESFLRQGAGPEQLVGRTVYGESRPNPEAGNLRGQVVQLFDQAGVVTSDEYDFKGNLLRSQRQLAREYKTTLDWAADVPLEAEIYTSQTQYDALSGKGLAR